MHLGADRDDDRDDSGHDENGTGQSGNAGAEAYQRRGRGGARRLWPGHDHPEPAYAPPLRIPHTPSFRCAFPRVFRSRSLIFPG
jgi:hypothetical protein